MDPDKALEEVRGAIAELGRIDDIDPADITSEDIEAREDAIESLRTYVEALDQWLGRKGFLPRAWSR